MRSSKKYMMKKNKKLNTKLVTHNGSFHTDDVFAAAALTILMEKKGKAFEIVRTRDEAIIKTGDFVFDVGGIYDPKKNRFDHHQGDFKEKRENGIVYSSFGLVWKKYGKEICGGEEVKNYIDQMLVEQVDATDNGINIFKPTTTHIFNYDISSAIASFLPVWGEKDSPKQFQNAVKFAKSILEKEIKQFNALLKAKSLIKKAYSKSKDKRLLILDVEIPRYLVDIATNQFKDLIYIIFRDEKNWKVLAVRKDAGLFANKKDLPKSWAGLRDEGLQKISGVEDAVFCHRALFLAVARSKEGAIKLAQIAVE